MDHMTRSQSQQLIDNLFRKNNNSNHYQHHNLPARNTMRTFDKSNMIKVQSSPKKMVEIGETGRDLYPQIKKKREIPGPGSYECPQKKTNSFTIFNKMTIPRRVKHNRALQQKLGPGIYTIQKTTSEALLSQYRKTTTSKFYPSPVKQRLTFSVNKNPGPGNYDFDSKLNRISTFSQTSTYKISSLKRSDIVHKNSNLAPGYYDWQKFYSKNQEKKKPIIEYKFVHGHP